MCDASGRLQKRPGVQSFIVNGAHLYPLTSLYPNHGSLCGKAKDLCKNNKRKNNSVFIKN